MRTYTYWITYEEYLAYGVSYTFHGARSSSMSSVSTIYYYWTFISNFSSYNN